MATTAPPCFSCHSNLTTLRCSFCHRHFCDADCSPTAIFDCRYEGDFVCGAGCSAAFVAGKLEASRSRTHRCNFPGCNKVYALKKQLQVHIDAVHNNVRYGPCPCCNLTFTAKHKLVTHLKRKCVLLVDTIHALD